MLVPSIKINNLSKIYFSHISDNIKSKNSPRKELTLNDKTVLDKVSLEFNSGETVGIIGRNGAGKSTLLSILAGISQHTSGEINIFGKVTAVLTLGVGLRDDLTGRENIYLDGQLQGKTSDEIKGFLDEIISFSELEEFIDKPLKYYSTGMKSRLAFSMLTSISPEILIIDEALSAGDVFFANKATNKIKEICNKGKIVIIVSHSMATIEAMCSRCIWLEKGKVMMDGNSDEVTQSYLKAIRDDDLSKEIKNFYVNYGETLDSAHYKILNISIKLANSDYNQSVFFTKDHLLIEIEIIRSKPGNAILSFFIERSDGLIVSLEKFDILEENHFVNIPFILELSQCSLVLNKGYYKLKIEVLENESCTNKFIRCFEVKNDHMAKGGASLLQYPAEIMLVNEEIGVCSDLIEMIIE